MKFPKCVACGARNPEVAELLCSLCRAEEIQRQLDDVDARFEDHFIQLSLDIVYQKAE